MKTSTIRTICVVYWACLTVLLVVPNPAGLLRVRWPSQTLGPRGVHFVFFVTLALLVLASRWPMRIRVLAGVLIGYAVATEALQWLVPKRTFELLDLLENLLGLLVGAVLWAISGKRLGKNR
jgi:VanZ family protein